MADLNTYRGWLEEAKRLNPDVPESVLIDYWMQNVSRAPKQPEEPGFLSDTASSFKLGLVGLGESARELGRRIFPESVVNAFDKFDEWTGYVPSGEGTYEEKLQRKKQDIISSMSPEAQEARQKPWVTDEGFGSAWSDPMAYWTGLVEAIPGTVATMGPTGLIARKVGASVFDRLVARGVAEDVAKKEAGKAMMNTAYFAGGPLEGLQQAGSTGAEVRRSIEQMDQAVLDESDAYNALVEGGLSPQEARKKLAEDASAQAMLLSGAVTSVFGGAGDRVLAKILSRGLSGNVIQRIAKGAFAEGMLEEFPQGYGSKVAENIALQKADPSIQVTQGALNEAVGGAVIGGLMGGAMAAPFPEREAEISTKKALDALSKATSIEEMNAAAIQWTKEQSEAIANSLSNRLQIPIAPTDVFPTQGAGRQAQLEAEARGESAEFLPFVAEPPTGVEGEPQTGVFLARNVPLTEIERIRSEQGEVRAPSIELPTEEAVRKLDESGSRLRAELSAGGFAVAPVDAAKEAQNIADLKASINEEADYILRSSQKAAQSGNVAEAAKMAGVSSAMRQTEIVAATDAEVKGAPFIRAMAKAFGADVQFFKVTNGRAANGYVINRNGRRVLYINVNSTRAHMQVAGHELSHYLEANYPDLYAEARNKIVPILRQSAVSEITTRYAGRGLSQERLKDELLSDLFGVEIGNRALWRELSRRDPSLFKRLAARILEFLDTVLRAIRVGNIRALGESRKIVQDVQDARKVIADTLAEVATRVSAGRAAARAVAAAEAEAGRAQAEAGAIPTQPGEDRPLAVEFPRGVVSVRTEEGPLPLMSTEGQKPDSVGRLATKDDFTRDKIKDILKLDGWAIITAENPEGKPPSEDPEEAARINAQLTRELVQYLESEGIEYIELRGRYSSPEQPEEVSFVIFASRAKAMEIAKRFRQESILTKRGLEYANGSLVPVTGDVDVYEEVPENFYSRIKGQNWAFQVGLDFDNQVSASIENESEVNDNGFRWEDAERAIGIKIPLPERLVSAARRLYFGDFNLRGQRQGETGKMKVTEVAGLVYRRATRAFRGKAKRDFTPENMEFIARVIAADALLELKLNPDRNGSQWYRDTMERAISEASKLYPEVSSENGRLMFTLALAITSNGTSIEDNVQYAFQQYKQFRKTGRFPTRFSFGGERSSTMRKQFELANQLLARFKGNEALLKSYVFSKAPAKEVMLEFGVIDDETGEVKKKSIPELVDEQVYRSTAFGPKVGGAFWPSLNGIGDVVTMDRWFMRTWGRITGTGLKTNEDGSLALDGDGNARMVDAPTGGGQRSFIRKTMARAVEMISEKGYDIRPTDLQALLWYVEKRYYQSFGATDSRGSPTDYDFHVREYVKRARRNQGGRDAGTGSGRGVAPKLEARQESLFASVSEPDEPAERSGRVGAIRFKGIHYSNIKRFALSGSAYGSGIKGAEAARVFSSKDHRIKNRVYFYIRGLQEQPLPRPEAGLGFHVHEADLGNIYDASADEAGIWAKFANIADPAERANARESAIIDAGYDGYASPKMGVAVVLNKFSVPVRYIGDARNLNISKAFYEPPGAIERDTLMESADEPIFYSELLRKVQEIPARAMPAQDWIARINSMPGIKKEEIEISGVREWLNLAEGRVTKEQVVDFLKQAEIPLYDFIASSNKKYTSWSRGPVKIKESGNPGVSGYTVTYTMPDGRFVRAQSKREGGEYKIVAQLGNESGRTEVQHVRDKSHVRMAIAIAAGKLLGVDKYTFPVGSIGTVYAPAFKSYTDQSRVAENYTEIAVSIPSDPKGRHYPVPGAHDITLIGDANRNRIFHIRVDERTVNGVKQLFIHEIQSDWAQAGRDAEKTVEGKRVPGFYRKEELNTGFRHVTELPDDYRVVSRVHIPITEVDARKASVEREGVIYALKNALQKHFPESYSYTDALQRAFGYEDGSRFEDIDKKIRAGLASGNPRSQSPEDVRFWIDSLRKFVPYAFTGTGKSSVSEDVLYKPRSDASEEWRVEKVVHLLDTRTNQYQGFTDYFSSKEEAIREALELINEDLRAHHVYNVTLGRVPHGPYVTDTELWVTLALKRAIRHAVDVNAKQVVWTTGRDQEQRYRLSQVLSKIEVSAEYRGPVIIEAFGVNGDTVFEGKYENNLDGSPSTVDITRSYVRGIGGLQTVQGVFGQGVAEKIDQIASKIKSGESEVIEGDGLEVASMGMRVFYGDESGKVVNPDGSERLDSKGRPVVAILPTIADKVVKKLGGSGTRQIETVYKDEPAKRFGFDITPKMVETVKAGIPRYSIAQKPSIAVNSEEHKAEIDKAIRSFLGQATADRLISSGFLRPMWSWEDEFRADTRARAYLQEGDRPRVAIYYDRISDRKDVPSVLLHEIGAHFGIRRMLGDEEYSRLLDQVRALKDTTFSEEWAEVKRAYVDEPGGPLVAEGSDRFVDEVIARAVESRPEQSLIRRIINAIRAWLATNIGPFFAGRLDADLLRGFATSALRSEIVLREATEETAEVQDVPAPAQDVLASIDEEDDYTDILMPDVEADAIATVGAVEETSEIAEEIRRGIAELRRDDKPLTQDVARLGREWLEISKKNKGMFTYPFSDSKKLSEVAKTMSGGLVSVHTRKPDGMEFSLYTDAITTENLAQIGIRRFKPARVHDLHLKLTKDQAKAIADRYARAMVYESDDGVVALNISLFESGVTQGNLIYQIVGTWAHNAGMKFIGDPLGLSARGIVRRTENMFVNALRTGSTKHLLPHPYQRNAGLSWLSGDDEYNVGAMAMWTHDVMERFVPDQFSVAMSTVDGQRPTKMARPGKMSISKRVMDIAKSGPRTSGRVAITEALMRMNAENAPEVTEDRGGKLEGRIDSGLMEGKILYSLDTTMEDVRGAIHDLFKREGTISWWDRTVGTQYAKAQKNTRFAKVYNLSQKYLSDTSMFANAATDYAPSILPKMEHWTDALRGAGADIFGHRAKDIDVASKALFDGTIEDRVWTDDELRERGLNSTQIGMYRQMRRAINTSLDQLAVSEMHRLTRNMGLDEARKRIIGMPADRAKELLLDEISKLPVFSERQQEALKLVASEIKKKANKIEGLKATGYAPLMRFGRYAVEFEQDGERHFMMFESEFKRNRFIRELRSDPGVRVLSVGTMSQRTFELFRGLDPNALELFGETATLEYMDEDGNLKEVNVGEDQMFQQYLKLAIANRSAMKRLIKRKKVAGYSEDGARVLAQFIVSNARMASRNINLADMLSAVTEIDKTDGALRDEAISLVKYLQDPKEEASTLRGFLFFNFLGGSMAAALVNMTQPFMMSFPYLARWGASDAAAALTKGLRMAVSRKRPPGKLGEDLLLAEERGIVSPQEIYSLFAEANRSLSGDIRVRRALTLWGSLFSAAEQFNRRSTFIAAWEIGNKMGEARLQEIGFASPYEFAVHAVEETQGTYNKGNRPNWARGAVGATIFTFKQFSIHYLEWWMRLPRSQKVLALAMLVLVSGLQGLPFADDLDDLIDSMAQSLGYAWNTKEKKRDFLASVLGKLGSDIVMHGVSAIPGVPLDVQGRLSLGNLIPGTGLLKRSSVSPVRETLEVAGPAGGLAQSVIEGTKEVMAGNISGGATFLAPVAIRNIIRGSDMIQTGAYRDMRGRKIVDADFADAVVKIIGFQPTDVATASRTERSVQEMVTLARSVKDDISAQWADGVYRGDQETILDAKEKLRRWNEDNPEFRLQIRFTDIAKRVREMRKTRAERIASSAPKSIRREVGERLSR